MSSRPEMMQRALEQAARAHGRTRPNPMVGCVIARGSEIVSVGYHARAGTAHAEVVALRRAGARARGADVYVTLEPCNHHGRTAPCTEALIAARVKRVFVGVRDPNPIVDGRGIRRLRRAGITVEVGLASAACKELNEAFFFAVTHKRAFVVAKMAQSLDGRIATRTGVSQWITGPAARRAGHVLRNHLDAIMVGAGTVRADDPSLTCRIRGGRDPVRVVLDTSARLPPSAKIFALGKESSAPTWVFVAPDAAAERRRAIEAAGAETIVCPRRDGALDLQAVLSTLHGRGMLSVLVEGGPTLMGAMFDARLVNRVYSFTAPMIIGGTAALSSVGGVGCDELTYATRLSKIEARRVGSDWLLTGRVT